ncbi:MAG: hypothetical protein PHH75_07090 [Candidatus Omnitrophica bacterium]|nr:hypothetical protein [Candidatus Omnitrophota bacterium]MDD5574926.1 hypothetical protein [Candidatus Omnitrophota bacterium]
MDSPGLKRLKRQLWILRAACLLLAVLLVAASSDNFWLGISNYIRENSLGNGVDENAPFHKEIKKILKPLKYSGLKRLLRPDVWVSADFKQKKWTLHNVHRYDDQGRVVLEEGRYGVCQELAAYVYDQIQPLFKDRYDIRFVSVAESGFFPYPQGSHMGICIVQRRMFGEKVYFLDPTYHRYGDIDAFNEYLFFDAAHHLTLQTEHNADVTAVVNGVTPLVIRENYIIGLSMEAVADRFDKNNFTLSVIATRKYRYTGRHIFALKMADGKKYEIEDEGMAHFLLNGEEYGRLRGKIQEMFDKIVSDAGAL